VLVFNSRQVLSKLRVVLLSVGRCGRPVVKILIVCKEQLVRISVFLI